MSVPLTYPIIQKLEPYMFVGDSYQMTLGKLVGEFEVESSVKSTKISILWLHILKEFLCWMNKRYARM